MKKLQVLKSALVGGASVIALVNPSAAKVFDVPDGDLAAALNSYMQQSGVQLVYMDDTKGHRSRGAKGDYTDIAALTQILQGTGFTVQTMPSNMIGIVPAPEQPKKKVESVKLAAAAPAPAQAGVETVVVTAQKKSEDIQTVPIAVTALSQQQLTERQIAGGPDLLREVPNMDFTKTNFTGYNIEIRGIGTQAISVTTDPAVAVAFNGIPFIRNHFFEQEFYDLSDAEILRGPQGTLYGRNATAGVVNLKSALPTDQYEAMLSADMGNYSNRRLEGMLNLPIVGDTLDLRIAGEWTKRDGYSFNSITNQPIDGRDLWSSRVSLGWKPASDVQVYLVWEHFSEDDDRLRSGKQLCETDPGASEVGGVPVTPPSGPAAYSDRNYLSQGCLPTSLYSKSAFEVPNGNSLPYYDGFSPINIPVQGGDFDPYSSTTQSTNLRVIESTINPHYLAKNDTLELNADYDITPALTFTSQTGYNHDFLWSSEDYNRFDTAPGAFIYPSYRGSVTSPDPNGLNVCTSNAVPASFCGTAPTGTPCVSGSAGCSPAGLFCDPQLGCSDRLVAEDLSEEHAWQLSQEFRLASNFSGPLNFSVGGNVLHYETEENYYVFINTLTMAAYAWPHDGFYPDRGIPQNLPWVPGVSDNSNCLVGGFRNSNPATPNTLGTEGESLCMYIDPNPITSLNNEGHNYFLSQNPYILDSYAMFGEAYYDITKDVKLTGGLRWTDDQKHFIDIPSELLVAGYGYPSTGVVNQQWDEFTGRAAVNWTPQLDFTDQTLIYGSYAHGYKAGGANPPGAELLAFSAADISTPIHPLTFQPEFIEAFELGTKNSVLGDTLTLNGDIFFYNYTGYQISEIVDRTAINNNYNAQVKGAEMEANWEPFPGLKFGFNGGFEDATADKGDMGIDLMDRTAGTPGWIVVKPFVTQASNCILPVYYVAAVLEANPNGIPGSGGLGGACGQAYNEHVDPLTGLAYVPNPTVMNPSYGYTIPTGYPGFNPATAPNNGEGFDKNLGGNQLPNAPHFTTSLTAEYSMPVADDWMGTLHTDFYWQSQSWARIFNDNPYDKLHGYSNVNVSLILTSANGWQVMGYIKNVFNVTAITGDFLNSDDSGLTTNVFLTDPRLIGVRVTKQLDQGDGFWGQDWSGYDFITGLISDTDNGKPPLWIELGGQLSRLDDGQQAFAPSLMADRPSIFAPSQNFEKAALYGFDETGKISFEPDDSNWVFSASIRFGRSAHKGDRHQQTNPKANEIHYTVPGYPPGGYTQPAMGARFADTNVQNSERHLVMDFQVGKDVGLGMFGIADGSSVASLGVRFAQFANKTNIALKSDPDFHRLYSILNFPSVGINNEKRVTASPYHLHSAGLNAKRSFHGVGPSISWNASVPFAGDANGGELQFDWGANAAVLFGRQRAHVSHHATSQNHPTEFYPGRYVTSHYSANPPARSRMATVPNLGGFMGMSFKYQNAKVSFGYRADEFFGAMDGGIDTYKAENRGFFGPFANISIGIGG